MPNQPPTYKFTTGEFSTLKLNSGIPGRHEWWAKMMRYFEEADLFVLRFNSYNPDLPDYAGGGYHWKKGVNFIDMPWRPDDFGGDFVVKDNTVTFPSDLAFACFVHECQHFLHLYRDHGRCQAAGYEGVYNEDMPDLDDGKTLTPELVRLSEYEASYRAVFYGKMYRMFPGTDINFKTQLNNMFIRDMMLSEFWTKALAERLEKEGLKPNTPEANAWIDEHVISQVKRISDWANPKHDFPGILEE